MSRSDICAPDGASCLLDQPGINTVEASKAYFLLLSGQAHNYKEALDWLQFAYTGDEEEAYVVPDSTFLIRSVVSEGYPLFASTLIHLQRRYTSAYPPPLPKSTITLPQARFC